MRRSWLVAVFVAMALPAAAAQPGVYVDWGSPNGRESNVEAFEKWTGRTGLLALDFLPSGSWASLTSTANWLPGYWWQYNRNRNVVWSVPLTVSGVTLRQVAGGVGDAAFQVAANQIAWAQPNAIIRLGWEMNGNWFPWTAANGHAADYVAAFQRVARIFRAKGMRIDWCVAFGYNDMAAEQAYPGDAYVDIVGMDIYDINPDDPADAWQQYWTNQYGLLWHQTFAETHRKPMSYPEWAIGQEGDDPIFMDDMMSWIRWNNVAYHDYWNTNAGYPGIISQYPNSAAEFLMWMR